MFIVQSSIAGFIGAIENESIMISVKDNRSKEKNQSEYITKIEYM